MCNFGVSTHGVHVVACVPIIHNDMCVSLMICVFQSIYLWRVYEVQ